MAFFRNASPVIITCSGRSLPQPTFKRSAFRVALLALSADGAGVFPRKRVFSQRKGSIGKIYMSAKQLDTHEHFKNIDSHVHVWAPPDQAEAFPYFPGQEPTISASVEVLLQAMEEGGVDGALIVQPINHKFDHSYLSRVLQMHPEKFIGCCLANPSDGGEGISEMERLVTKEGYRAVRFNPYLWPSGQKMTNDVGKALFSKAGELGIPVGFMCFQGLLLHIEEIDHLCYHFPATQVLLDHLGFCKPPLNDLETKAWKALLRLSKYPQVYIKVSAFFRISREHFPHEDTWPLLEQLLATFGSKRLLWGSDFPFVVDECGYVNAKRILELAKGNIGLTDEDLDCIMGKTAMEVFKGSWVMAL